jgi:hypothetical protein
LSPSGTELGRARRNFALCAATNRQLGSTKLQIIPDIHVHLTRIV